jgi:heme/copper-type cytochrome/quinol oxidase subunit 3
VTRRALDVASLPSYAFGQRSLLWWATVWLIAIESTMFALAIVTYLYLRDRSSVWPMEALPPALRWGTLNTIVMLLSAIPNELAKKAAERLDLRGVHVWMVVCIVFGASFIVIRALEFTTLRVLWDQNAYGSVVWLLLGLHTAHVVTDFGDTIVLAVLMFTGPLEEKRFVDVSENALYWYFVILAWLPIYGVVYLLPRFG